MQLKIDLRIKLNKSLTELVVCCWLKKSGYKSINTISKQIHTRRMALEAMVIGKERCIKNLMVTFLETQVTVSQNSLHKAHQEGREDVEIVGSMVTAHKIANVQKKEKGKEHKQQPEANMIVGAGCVETGALLLAEVQSIVHGTSQVVHLSEEKVIHVICPEGVWVLDTGASNHMTGTKSTLSHLDESVSGSVRFGDGSTVEICGLGSVVVQGKHNQHKVLTSFYYIPKLKSNIVSLGQLEEAGCDIRLFNGKLSVLDPERNLLISAPRTGNRLYTLKLDVVSPVCSLTMHDDVAWKWHARFGHLNFSALRDMGRLKLVEGMPLVDRVEPVCDECVLVKQHHTPFPKESSFRAKEGLELCHAYLCGQVRPQTFGGKSYFLLVVADYNRYMWVELLRTNDQALMYL